jgi:hypothetical protein
MNRDRYDLPLTTVSEHAAASYRDGVDRILSAWYGADDAFDRAILEDPAFALAYIARARIHQLNMESAEARAKAAHARQLAATATRRERQHVEILAAAIEGQPKLALTSAEQHLEEFPRDVLVFGLLLGAFGLYAFSGRADHDAARLATCERHARHYGEDWWFLTYLGWSHTEAGNVGTGRTLTERALALRLENGNAAHALSHALFEQGDPAAGRTFLSGWLPAHEHASFLLPPFLARRADGAGGRRFGRRAGNLPAEHQAVGSTISADERFYGLRVAAVAAFARRQDWS